MNIDIDDLKRRVEAEMAELENGIKIRQERLDTLKRILWALTGEDEEEE